MGMPRPPGAATGDESVGQWYRMRKREKPKLTRYHSSWGSTWSTWYTEWWWGYCSWSTWDSVSYATSLRSEWDLREQWTTHLGIQTVAAETLQGHQVVAA